MAMPSGWNNPFATFKPAPMGQAPMMNAGSKPNAPVAQKAAPARQASQPRQAPRKTVYSSQGYTGGGGGAVAPVAAAPVAPSEADYLNSDSIYQASLSALQKQLANYQNDVGTQKKTYDLDYNKALHDLGYIAPDAAAGAADPNAAPQWNWEDQLTTSGKSYQNLINDFAARGMLQSSGFAQGQNDLTKSLMDQYNGLNTARQSFLDNLTNQQATYADQNTAANQQAKAEAILRRAAQFGLTS